LISVGGRRVEFFQRNGKVASGKPEFPETSAYHLGELRRGPSTKFTQLPSLDMHRLPNCGNLLIKRLAAGGSADQLVKSATGLLAKAEHIRNGIPILALERLDGIEAVFNFVKIDRVLLKSRRIAFHRRREVMAGSEGGWTRW